MAAAAAFSMAASGDVERRVVLGASSGVRRSVLPVGALKTTRGTGTEKLLPSPTGRRMLALLPASCCWIVVVGMVEVKPHRSGEFFAASSSAFWF